MKKFMKLVLVLGALAVTGCGGSGNPCAVPVPRRTVDQERGCEAQRQDEAAAEGRETERKNSEARKTEHAAEHEASREAERRANE